MFDSYLLFQHHYIKETSFCMNGLVFCMKAEP